MSDSLLETDLSDLLRKGYAELEKLLEEQSDMDIQQFLLQSKIAKLSQKIIQLAIASDDQVLIDAVRETGLSDAVRSVLIAADVPMTAVELRKRLEAIGFDLSQYQNFLATLYLTLQRLEKQGEVTEDIFLGKKVYKWHPARPENALIGALRGAYTGPTIPLKARYRVTPRESKKP